MDPGSCLNEKAKPLTCPAPNGTAGPRQENAWSLKRAHNSEGRWVCNTRKVSLSHLLRRTQSVQRPVYLSSICAPYAGKRMPESSQTDRMQDVFGGEPL